MKKEKKLYGVGVVIDDYCKTRTEMVKGKNVKVWRCPYYSRWENMLQRCYSKSFHDRQRSYADCSVCEEWLVFDNFKSWMEKQEWVERELDKDVLCFGNKIYSPTTCIFIKKSINLKLNNILKFGISRITYDKSIDRYRVYCMGKYVKVCRDYESAVSVYKIHQLKLLTDMLLNESFNYSDRVAINCIIKRVEWVCNEDVKNHIKIR